tara:strand:- start:607 stop:1074 length:468 start_codon:yes stop_codon:yes gene_type:complete
MKKLSLSLSSFVIIILFFFLFFKSSTNNISKGKAIIIDGDTIKISGERIRFSGIDTPEKKEIGHKLSKKKLRDKIGNNIVTCYREKNKDKWGRSVADCFVNGESISSFMVKNGYACDYVKYSKKKYAKEQLYAKANKLGIWKMQFKLSWEKKCKK